MILADTSAWVEYDRATGSGVHRRMAELIATESSLSVTEPVIMEVLAGARTDERERQLRRLLLRFALLRFDAKPLLMWIDDAVGVATRRAGTRFGSTSTTS
jgi:predicted nucleic acid-binding protein